LKIHLSSTRNFFTYSSIMEGKIKAITEEEEEEEEARFLS
jgi:hypothetical protein